MDQGVQFTLGGDEPFGIGGWACAQGWGGRCHDNLVVERLWRSGEYERLDPLRCSSGCELEAGLKKYFVWYIEFRPQQSLQYRVSASVHAGA